MLTLWLWFTVYDCWKMIYMISVFKQKHVNFIFVISQYTVCEANMSSISAFSLSSIHPMYFLCWKKSGIWAEILGNQHAHGVWKALLPTSGCWAACQVKVTMTPYTTLFKSPHTKPPHLPKEVSDFQWRQVELTFLTQTKYVYKMSTKFLLGILWLSGRKSCERFIMVPGKRSSESRGERQREKEKRKTLNNDAS